MKGYRSLDNLGVAAEYPSIGSYNPEKAGYMDTQLSPANALRTRNTCLVSAKWLRGYAVVKATPPRRNLLVRE